MSWKMALLDTLVKSVPDKPLGDDAIRPRLAEASVQESLISKELEGLTFALDAGTSVSVEAFNSPGDVDTLGVVGTSATAAGDNTLAPVLPLGGPQAWLKYAAEVRVKAATGSLRVPFVSLEASGEVRVQVADYRAHAASENARAALQADAQGPLRLPMHAGNLARLGVRDAMAFLARGTLSTSVTLPWADVFSTNLGPLEGLVPANTLLGLEVSASASLSASVQVTDDHAVVISRPEPGRLHLALKKGVARRNDFAARAGVSVGALASEQLAPQVVSLLEALLATPLARFESALEGLQQGTLSDTERKLLRLALDRLGLQELEADPAALKKAWLELRQKTLPARIEALARQKIELGFAYEYGRIAEHTTLLALTCTDAQALELHAPLLCGRLDEVSQRVRAMGIAPERCLLEDISTRTQAWGFSLRLGSWSLGGQDKKVLRYVVQRNSLEPEAPRRVAFLGTRSYTENLGASSREWVVDLRCDMADFRPQPHLADCEYGLYMLLRTQEPRPSEGSLRLAVDEAIVWRVLDDADEEQVLKQVREAAEARPGEPVSVETRLELKVADGTLRELMQLAAAPDANELVARALARALPWDNAPCRDMPENRESIYAPLWRGFLKDGGWSVADAARAAARHLKGHPLVSQAYAWREGTVQEASQLTFAEVIQKNPGTVGRCRDFRAALLALHNDVVARRSPESLPRHFEGLEGAWGTSFHLKATGAFLLQLAQRGTRGLSGVERTFTVSLPGVKRQLIFSKTR